MLIGTVSIWCLFIIICFHIAFCYIQTYSQSDNALVIVTLIAQVNLHMMKFCSTLHPVIGVQLTACICYCSNH